MASGEIAQQRSGGCKRLLHRLCPCLKPRGQQLEDARVGLVPSSASGSFVSTNSFLPVSREHALEELRQGIFSLDQLDLSPQGVVACAQLKQSLRQLEGARPSSSSRSRAGSGRHDVPAEGDGVKHGVRLQEELSLQTGALAPALNRVVTLLWPRIDQYVKDLVQNSIEPSINEALPGIGGMRPEVKFGTVSLGASSPSFGPITVEDDKDTGTIDIHIKLRFASDLDVQFTAMKIPIGISKLFLDGVLAVRLAPSAAKPPFFGGMQIYFVNPPEISLDFNGALQMVKCPGLRVTVRSCIANAVANKCVLPRRIAVDMDEEDKMDAVDLQYPEPIGILRLRVFSASNLTGHDFCLLGPATSDPYVAASLGLTNWTSDHVKKTVNPVWGKEGEGVAADFPVHDLGQALSIKVFDYDWGSADDLIGIAEPLIVGNIQGIAKQELPLKSNATDGKPAGKIVISSELLKLRSRADDARKEPPSLAHLSFKVLSVTGISHDAAYPFKVQLQVWNGSTSEQAPLKVATTHESAPSPQESLAEQLQRICSALQERKGCSPHEIAEILGVDESQVDRFLKAKGDTKLAEKLAKEADVVRAATKPCFDEVLQVLLPSVEDSGTLGIALIDKKGKKLGETTVAMCSLVQAPEARLEGPFALGKGLELTGSLCLRWLA